MIIHLMCRCIARPTSAGPRMDAGPDTREVAGPGPATGPDTHEAAGPVPRAAAGPDPRPVATRPVGY